MKLSSNDIISAFVDDALENIAPTAAQLGPMIEAAQTLADEELARVAGGVGIGGTHLETASLGLGGTHL